MIHRILLLLVISACVSGCYFPYDPENSEGYDRYWRDKEKSGRIIITDPFKSEDAHDVSPGI